MNYNKILTGNKIDALLTTNPTNIFYLSGFKGVSPTEREALLFIKKNKNVLLTAMLYQTEARKVASSSLEVKIAKERDEYENIIKESLLGIKKLGFEANDLKYAEFKKFKKYQKALKLYPTKLVIENLRQIKSEDEIKKITRAQLITQKTFVQAVKFIKLGQTEAEIAQMLIKIMNSLGAQGPSFDPIVASGKNSALPHYPTGKRKIKKGDTLLFDFGAKYKNYCADFSRTIFIGQASDIQRKMFNLVIESQKKAFLKIRNGEKAKKVFEASHKVFKDAKLDSHFIHSLGHGIGLEVHEKPNISAKSKDLLKTGMVFSIEPGLYFPWGGIRIEDLVAISKSGKKKLGANASFIEISG